MGRGYNTTKLVQWRDKYALLPAATRGQPIRDVGSVAQRTWGGRVSGRGGGGACLWKSKFPSQRRKRLTGFVPFDGCIVRRGSTVPSVSKFAISKKKQKTKKNGQRIAENGIRDNKKRKEIPSVHHKKKENCSSSSQVTERVVF